MQYPAILEPVGVETIRLPSGKVISVPKAKPHFRRWLGQPLEDTYGNKPVLDVQGLPAFAEILILGVFRKHGWDGVWVDTFRKKFRTECYPMNEVALPPAPQQVYGHIFRRAGSRAGCWDVFCWHGGEYLWAEAKLGGRDRLRKSQANWLNAAMKEGFGPSSFLVVEWSA
jgi:hypothetical protein